MVSAIYDKDNKLIKYIDNQWVYEDGTPIDNEPQCTKHTDSNDA